MADPFSSWGPEESGIRIAEKDAQARGKAALEAYETLGNIAMQPDKAGLLKSQGRLARARADQEELENDAARRLQTAMQQTELPDDPIEALSAMAKSAVRAGSTKEATTLLQRMSQGVQQRAQAQRALSQAETAQVEREMKKNNDFANALGGVTSQAGLDAANLMHREKYGEPSPLEGKPYDPAKVRALQDSTLTANQRLVAKAREIEEKGRNWGRAETARHNKAVEGLREAENDRRVEADAVKAKNGGKGVGKPSREDRMEAEALIKEYQPDVGKDSKGRELAGESIASRAMELIRGNRALSRTEAIQRAYDEEVKAGSFEKQGGVDLPVVGKVGEKVKYRGMGRTAATARPMPAGSDKFNKGSWYNTSKGPGYWNGSVFLTPEERDEEED